ncbi:MAG TPA: hypothetical protein VK190_05750, partial [Pseudoneobacillus sp.]|nr:hypothetical protein [Pseudoneobacillus sp.]
YKIVTNVCKSYLEPLDKLPNVCRILYNTCVCLAFLSVNLLKKSGILSSSFTNQPGISIGKASIQSFERLS